MKYGVTYEVSSPPKDTALLGKKGEPSAFNCSLNLHLHGRKLSFQKIPNCPIVSYRVLRLFLSFPLTGHTFLPLCVKTSSSYGQNIICVCIVYIHYHITHTLYSFLFPPPNSVCLKIYCVLKTCRVNKYLELHFVRLKNISMVMMFNWAGDCSE